MGKRTISVDVDISLDDFDPADIVEETRRMGYLVLSRSAVADIYRMLLRGDIQAVISELESRIGPDDRRQDWERVKNGGHPFLRLDHG